MILTEYNGQAVYLLDIGPDWMNPFQAEVSLISQIDAGLTNRETRRPHSLTLRLRSRFSLTAEDVDARRFIGGLRALTSEPVAIPFWAAVVKWGDRGSRQIGAGLNLVFKEDFSQFEIFESDEPDWPEDNDLLAPLLWGRLENRDPSFATPNLLTFKLDHSEESPAAWAVDPVEAEFAAGPIPSMAWSVAPRVFPFEINFMGRTDKFSVSVLREQIGFSRLPAKTFYPQAVAREQQTQHFAQSAVDAGRLLSFFKQHAGGKAFWAPNWINAVWLTAAVGAADTVLHVSDTAAVNAGDWIIFDGVGGSPGVTARILVKTANTITVDAAPGAMSAETMVSHLLLVRFQEPKLTLQWRHDEYVECQMPLRELPAEYTPGSDEVLGTTLGLLPTRCYLYEWSRVLNGVTFTDRYTSFEGDQSHGGNTYYSKSIGHGDIVQGLALDRDQVDVKMDLVPGSAPVLLATLKMESPLYLKIFSADTDGANASNVNLLFSGEVVTASPRGSRIGMKAISAGSLFDRKVPGFYFQPSCNVALFSVGCGLVAADWKFSAVVDDAGAPGYPFEFVLETVAGVGASAIAAVTAVAIAENYFAGGWVEFGAGASWQRRAILLSTELTAGALTLTLDRDPDPFPAHGDGVVLFPGCDLQAATCREKFLNYVNFRGHQFISVANPSLANASSTGGGKKS